MPRIVFMGTPQFAVPSLEACLDLGEVVTVVTQPDKPRGRGQELSPGPVKAAALARGLQVLQPVTLKDGALAQALRALEPDVAVVTAYGKILPKELLALPARGCVNVHASLLPRFRGAAPIQWAIAEGDTQTGVGLMQMDAGMDTGPVIAQLEHPIGPADTSASLHQALAALGATLLRQALPAYLRGELAPRPQPSEGVLLAPMIRKEQGRLDFSRPAAVLERRLRAFTPWPGAFTSLAGALLKVHEAAVADGAGEPGAILRADADGVEVACGQGSLVLRSLQLEGKRAMTAREFLAGRPLAVGAKPFA